MDHSASDSASSKQPDIDPATLLWNYELQRQNQILINHSNDLETRLEKAQTLVKKTMKSLRDTAIIIASFRPSQKDTMVEDNSRLRMLRRRIRRVLAPLKEHPEHEEEIEKTTILIDYIAELEKLNSMNEQFISESMVDSSDEDVASTTSDDSAEEYARGRSTTPRSQSQSPSTQSLNSQDATKQGFVLYTEGDPLSVEMKQNDQPLENYYRAVNTFRRKRKRLRQVDERVLIDAFIAGLDDDLQRRRMIHWMRSEGWTWAWLEHIVMFIIREEEYMVLQDYALAHRLEDGSVLFPDGSRHYRFAILAPITEEDLTPSEMSE